MLGPHRRPIECKHTSALENPIDDRVRQVFVVQHASPPCERFVRREDHRPLLAMSIVHHVEEHVGGIGAVREIADLIDHQYGRMDIARERLGQPTGAKRR
jgi:hypothetical protein